MYTGKKISINDFVSAISETADLVSPVFKRHQKEVAYVSYRIAREMRLPEDEIRDIVLASLLHDIGAFSIGERIKIHTFQPHELEIKEHAYTGYKLLKNFAPFANAAGMVKFHHTGYDESEYDVPVGAYIIHLADRLCILVNENREILAQIPEIMEKISQTRNEFHPDTFDVMNSLAGMECFWIEAFSLFYSERILKTVSYSKEIAGLQTLRDFAKLISQMIDFRSRYTATHSSGVAAVAAELAAISGCSENECSLMEIAGYMHDLGKLAVSNNILEKNGKLNMEEFSVVRKHTYYTYAILSNINGLEDLAVWAAYHHEKLDGSGYPFHVTEDDFPLQARVMAVADIITALMEDRPYRPGMTEENAAGILLNMAKNKLIDKSIVDMASSHFSHINNVREKAQQEEKDQYSSFNEDNLV